MKRVISVEQLQDAIMLNKEIYFSLYHSKGEGKMFKQLMNPQNHIDELLGGEGVYASNVIE